jgi:hypothetical protein
MKLLLNVVHDMYCNVLFHFLSKDCSCASNKSVHFKIHLCATLQKYAEHMK